MSYEAMIHLPYNSYGGVSIYYALCCPVLNPQITGEATPPGEETVNWSVAQSPMELPAVFRGAVSVKSTVVPTTGSAMTNVYKKIKKKQGTNIWGDYIRVCNSVH